MIFGGKAMTILRSSCRRGLAWGVAACAVALVVVGCATSEAQRADAPTAQPRAAEPDLTGAHLDKHKFLLGVSMLGKSPEQDKELLYKITGKVFEPKPSDGKLPPGEKAFVEDIQNLRDSPMLITGGYAYNLSDERGYRPDIYIGIERKAVCITVEDVTAVMGAPTRIWKTYETTPHRMQGPTDIGAISYIRHNNIRLAFIYNAALCADRLALLPNQK